VFENEISKGGAKAKIKKVSFQKRYKAADGEWKSTTSLDANDIPKAVLVLNKAYEYLLMGNGPMRSLRRISRVCLASKRLGCNARAALFLLPEFCT